MNIRARTQVPRLSLGCLAPYEFISLAQGLIASKVLIAKFYVSIYSTNIPRVLYSLQNRFYAVCFDPVIQAEVSRIGMLTITWYR